MEQSAKARPVGEPGMTMSREARIGLGVAALAIAAMAVDHLMGDDPGLEDPGAFAVAAGLILALAAVVFGRLVPRAKAAGDQPARAERDGLLLSVVAVAPGITTIWLGLPFVLAGGGLALGLHARRLGAGRRAAATVALGALVLVGATVAYLVQAIDKLG